MQIFTISFKYANIDLLKRDTKPVTKFSFYLESADHILNVENFQLK